MSVAVIVPYRAGCPHREAAWGWVQDRYATTCPDWDIVVGDSPTGPWCKALAVLDALRRTTADRLVIADADVWCEQVRQATETPHPVVIPHRLVLRLDQSSTDRLLAGEQGEPTLDRYPYTGRAGGGVTILTRDVWNQVPMDPRFIGWGQEDDAWWLAMIAVLPRPVRFKHDLIHLWHPPQPKMFPQRDGEGEPPPQWGSPESKALLERYEEARIRPDTMRALIAEFAEEMAA